MTTREDARENRLRYRRHKAVIELLLCLGVEENPAIRAAMESLIRDLEAQQ